MKKYFNMKAYVKSDNISTSFRFSMAFELTIKKNPTNNLIENGKHSNELNI